MLLLLKVLKLEATMGEMKPRRFDINSNAVSKEHIKVPMIAAGGIATGRAMLGGH